MQSQLSAVASSQNMESAAAEEVCIGTTPKLAHVLLGVEDFH